MVWIYLATVIFGGAFVVPMLLGGLDSDLDAGEVDTGVDVDGAELEIDAGVDVDVDAGSDVEASSAAGPVDVGSLGSIFAGLFSFRSLVFFSAFFGASGLVFTALDYSVGVTLFTALLIGLVAALLNSALFTLIRSSQSTSQISDRSFEGRPASVVLPIEVGRRGRIRVDLNGQPHYLVARCYDERAIESFDVGASVVVVQIENGTALVASLAELDPGQSE